jgi:hypothetical protein
MQQEERGGPEVLLEVVALQEVLLEVVALREALLNLVPAGYILLDQVALEVAAERGYQEEYDRQGRLFRNLEGNLEVRKVQVRRPLP